MKKILQFEIECGETTCASSPGIFCSFGVSDCFGRSECFFFGPLDEKDGWVQRHQLCIEKEVSSDEEGNSIPEK